MVARNGQISGFDNETEQRDILKLSRVTAVVLLFSEFQFLVKPCHQDDPLTTISLKSTFRISTSSSFPTRLYTTIKLDRNPRRFNIPLATSPV